MTLNTVVSYADLGRDALQRHLAALDQVRVGLVGDLGLDVYWHADMSKSELSRETPHYPLPIYAEQYAPGAGANVAANLIALRPQAVHVLGVLGQDWRGDVLLREMNGLGMETSEVIRSAGRVTSTYIKPMRHGLSRVVYEDPRLDFANDTAQSAELDEAVVHGLDKLAGKVDILCVSDQFAAGCVTAAVRDKLVQLARTGLRVVVDSRYRIETYQGCYIKPNELEGAVAAGVPDPQRTRTLAELGDLAMTLAARTSSPVCLTLGARGCLLYEPQWEQPVHMPAVPDEPPIDICGAGDTFLAAFSSVLAGGASTVEAAAAASLASAVTIRKIGQTGTARREEILAQRGEHE